MIEQGLYQLITQNAAVQAAVGLDVNGVAKAYWVLAPQGASLPFLIFSRVGTTDLTTVDGPLGIREGLFQLVCYAPNYYTSRTVASTLRDLLITYTGTLPDADATVVKSIIIDKDWDAHYEEGNKSFIFAAYLQVRVWYYD
jgi:hypothetical protein